MNDALSVIITGETNIENSTIYIQLVASIYSWGELPEIFQLLKPAQTQASNVNANKMTIGQDNCLHDEVCILMSS